MEHHLALFQGHFLVYLVVFLLLYVVLLDVLNPLRLTYIIFKKHVD